VATKKRDRDRPEVLKLEPWAPPTPEEPTHPGTTQKYITRTALRTFGGIAVVDSERLDNTTTHRRVRTECIRYQLTEPSRTTQALARYYKREPKQASGSLERQTVITAACETPLIAAAHPIVRSIEASPWTKPPPVEIDRSPVKWVNPPSEVPRRRGNASKKKARVMDALAAMEREDPWQSELEVVLGALTASDKSSLDRTLRRLERDGDIERFQSVDLATGRQRTRIRATAIRE